MASSKFVDLSSSVRKIKLSRWRRPFSALCVVGGALLVSGGVVSTQSTDFVPTYTGCYNASSGTINKLSLGSVPQKNCGADARVAISAGDITAVNVSGGLTGGGTNGDITIGLDPKYTLPQSCPTNFIPKWNGTAWVCSADNDTTYAASTGLELLTSPLRFAIQEAYRLPQACADGSFAKKQGTGWVCAAAPSAGAVFNLTAPNAGIPDDGAIHLYLTTPSLAAGTYTAMMKGVIHSELNIGSTFSNTECSIRSGATTLDTISFGAATTDEIPEIPIALVGAITLAGPATISLACSTSPDSDGLSLEEFRMVVTKVPVS